MYVPEIEISVKFKGKPGQLKRSINSSRAAYNLAMEIFSADTLEWTEEFIMLCLNTAGEVIGFYRVSKGGINSTIVDVRVIATIALQCCATRVIVMHNHPTGTLKPSEADKFVTEKIKNGLQTLDIKLEEHLIVTTNGFYSFADEGML